MLPDGYFNIPPWLVASKVAAVEETLGISKNYRAGFTNGFDGMCPMWRASVKNNKQYLQGFTDGVDAHLETLRALEYLDDSENA